MVVIVSVKLLPASLKKEDVQLVIFEGKRVENEIAKYYDLAYEHWKQTWEEHFRERDGIEKLHSDCFTKQDEISAFFFRDTCLAALCTRVVDLQHQVNLDDSYFDMWDRGSISKLTKDGHRIAICGYFSIINECPKFNDEVRLRDVMIYLTVAHLMRSGINAISGVARKDKGMHKSFTLFGAETIQTDLTLHNGMVDLVAFYKGCPRTNDPKVAEISNYIWDRRVGQTQIIDLSVGRKVA
jgi:hypothetical protein